MRRIAAGIGVGLLVFAVVFGAFVGYLATGNRPPRRASDGWLRVRHMPEGRGELATAIVEGRPGGPRLCPSDPCPERLVFAVGGLGGAFARTSNRVDVFEPPANAWRRGPDLPEPRHHLAATGLGDTLYVTGGAAGATDFTPHANVWRLRPGRTSFERLAEMPEARAGHAMVAIRDRLYVVGGKGSTARVMIFDPAAGWKTGAPLPGSRDHAAAVAVADRVVVIGGRSDAGLSDRVDIYDTNTDTWSEGPPLPEANSAAAVAFLSDGLVHVVGGEKPNLIGGAVRDRHFVLDPAARLWLEGPKPLLAVHGTPAVNIQGRMLIIGGSRRAGPLSVLGWTGFSQVFDPALLSAQPTPSPTTQSSPSPSPSG
ncbi:MAG: Kelch repeat-containing protein [Actinomycetota bacterium]